MSDEFDQLVELGDKLNASPDLKQTWEKTSTLSASYAWYLLNHSWQLPPEIPRNFIPHTPSARLWDDAGGWTDNLPYTLTVFRSSDESMRCRHAILDDQKTAIKQRLIQFFENEGKIQFYEPKISVRDADIPFDLFHQHLQAIASHRIPAIVLQPPKHYSVSSDVGSIGFEYFSQDQPPAGIKYQWSCEFPSEWQPLLESINQLREFLLSCFDGEPAS